MALLQYAVAAPPVIGAHTQKYGHPHIRQAHAAQQNKARAQNLTTGLAGHYLEVCLTAAGMNQFITARL